MLAFLADRDVLFIFSLAFADRDVLFIFSLAFRTGNVTHSVYFTRIH
jgi:hypothetical protein